MYPLPVTDLLYVGKVAADTLGKYGIRTIGQLAEYDKKALAAKLGKPCNIIAGPNGASLLLSKTSFMHCTAKISYKLWE